MWNKLKAWFCGPTLLEQYQRGKDCADRLLAEGVTAGHTPADVAAHIYAMGYGAFDDTALERAFDDGLHDRLEELGYEEPHY